MLLLLVLSQPVLPMRPIYELSVQTVPVNHGRNAETHSFTSQQKHMLWPDDEAPMKMVNLALVKVQAKRYSQNKILNLFR